MTEEGGEKRGIEGALDPQQAEGTEGCPGARNNWGGLGQRQPFGCVEQQSSTVENVSAKNVNRLALGVADGD